MSSIEMNEAGPRVALLGAPAAYHDIATDHLSRESGEDERIRCSSFPEILEKLESGEADRAVIAVANSEIGDLADAYEIIAAHGSYVTGEVYLWIRHNLLVLPEVESVKQIEVVTSNPKALAQCKDYLATDLKHARRMEGPDTATCAQEVAKLGDPSRGAIASSQAAERYGLKIMEASIQTNPNNQTRFWMLEHKPREDDHANKTSLIMATPDTAASLWNVLGVWATRGISLGSIQSKLIKPEQGPSPWGAYLQRNGQQALIERMQERKPTRAWDAHFYIDVMAGLQEERMQEALGALATQTGVEHRILGSYQRGELVE